MNWIAKIKHNKEVKRHLKEFKLIYELTDYINPKWFEQRFAYKILIVYDELRSELEAFKKLITSALPDEM